MSKPDNKLNILEPAETAVQLPLNKGGQGVVTTCHCEPANGGRSNLYGNILDSDTAFRLLKDIEANPEITQRHLAAKHDISLGKTNYILNALIEKGIIKAQNFKNSKNKSAYMYVFTPEGIKIRTELARNFIQRKLQEFEQLRGEIDEFKNDINGVLPRESNK